MASYLNLGSGFQINSDSAIDRRFILTKAEMATTTEEHPNMGTFSDGKPFLIPEPYFCVCADDKNIYVHDATRTRSTETGYFFIASGGASDYTYLTNKPKINGVELVGEKTLDNLGIQPKYNPLDPSSTKTPAAGIEETTDKQFVSEAQKTEWTNKASIDDTSTTPSTSTTWSSSKISTELNSKQEKIDATHTVSAEYITPATDKNFVTDALITKIENSITKEVDNLTNYYTNTVLDTKLDGKVDEEVNGTTGKARIFNEADGGGAKFEHNDKTWSFVGVNDGGESGVAALIYAVDSTSAGYKGTKLDVTKSGIYYTTGDDSTKSAAVRDVAENEIIVKKTLDTGLATKIGEAPADGKQYARKNNNWEEVSVGTLDFEGLSNRPKYKGTDMDRTTDIPEVKTSTWDAKQDALPTYEAGKVLKVNTDASGLEWYKVNEVPPVSTTGQNKYLQTDSTGTVVWADLDASGKLNTLPGDAESGGNPYNLPYYFYTVDGADKIVVHAKTVTLDNNKVYGDYNLEVKAATTDKAGLMSASDKVKVDASASKADLDYTKLANKPKIAGKELSGDTTLDTLGIQPKITGETKVDAALITETADKKFVSDSEKTTWNAKYNKPTGGIPKTDLADDVKTSLGKADSALQPNTAITGATKCKITYDEKGLVTAGANLEATDIPDLTLAKITDITATATEVNVLDGITASTEELNYVDGVTSNIQTQLDSKQPNLPTVTNDRYLHTNSSTGDLEWSEVDMTSKEDAANKETTTLSATDNVKFPTSKVVADYAEPKANKKTSLADPDDTYFPTTQAVVTGLNSKIESSAKGARGGVATLNEEGKVPISLLPTTVAGIINGYLKAEDGKFYVDAAFTTEVSPQFSSQYVYYALDTAKVYRCDGHAPYVEISASLALGTSADSAYYGNKGQAAYEHSLIGTGTEEATKPANPHKTTFVLLNDKPKINNKDLTAGNNTLTYLGIQAEIKTDAKLSADLVDDASTTNKFVTATQKSNWDTDHTNLGGHTVGKDVPTDAVFTDTKPKYNGTVVTDATDIPEVKTSTWDAKANIDDNATGTDKAWSASKITTELNGKLTSALVTSFQTSPENDKYPSEKLVYDSFKTTKKVVTMTVADWGGGNTYDFGHTGDNLELEVADTATVAEFKAFGKAMIVGSATTNTVKALGTVPTINIPVILTVRKKV